MAREPAVIAEQRRILGDQLATFRQAADLTQGQLAQATICHRTQVTHIEKGRARADERFWRAADDACDGQGALLAGFHELEAAKAEYEHQAREQELATVRAKAAALRSPDRVTASTQTSFDMSVPAVWATGTPSSEDIAASLEMFSAADVASRRQVLAAVSVSAGISLVTPIRQWAASLPMPVVVTDVVSTNDIASLEQAVTVFRRWDASGTGGLQRKALVGQLNAMSEMLREPLAPRPKQRLFQIMAELAQLAGWMAYDQGLHGVAQKYYLLALHACREAACPNLAPRLLAT
jgi:transcriptional regulator with XRE-family HTH domain